MCARESESAARLHERLQPHERAMLEEGELGGHARGAQVVQEAASVLERRLVGRWLEDVQQRGCP